MLILNQRSITNSDLLTDYYIVKYIMIVASSDNECK
jgi:hypothetical protein